MALVDIEGFVHVVDALGGAELELATPPVVRMSPATEEADRHTLELPALLQLVLEVGADLELTDGPTVCPSGRRSAPGMNDIE